MNEGKISLFTAALMNINMMVGAGAFVYPQIMAEMAGYFSFFSWFLVALIFLPIVYSVANISKLFPGEGSFYHYSESTLGESAGFLSGWLYVLGYISVGCIHLLILNRIFSHDAGITIIGQFPTIFYMLFVGLFCTLLLFPLHTVGKIVTIGTIFKIIPLLFVCLLCFFYFAPPPGSIEAIPFSFKSLFLTLPYPLFGYWGFESCVSISHRIEGRKSNASKAIFIGFFATAVIYTLFNLGVLNIMGTENLAKHGVRAFVNYLPVTSVAMQNLLIVVIKSAITAAHIGVFFGTLIQSSQLFASMAKKKLIFFSDFLKKENSAKQPYIATYTIGLIMFLFTTGIASVKVLTSISNLGILSAFFLTLTSLLIIYRRKNDMTQIAVTLLAFASCSLLFYYSVLQIDHVITTLPFFGIAILGMIMYKINATLTKKKAIYK